MKPVTRHLTRTLLTGLVALLPLAGLVLGFLAAERTVADSWLADQPFYFPGLGLIGAVAVTYAIGLLLTTLIGKLCWSLVDKTLDRLPAIGSLYRTLKQVLGHGEGADGMFERVVLVPARDHDGHELGLVTNTRSVSGDSPAQLVVFVPAAPTPTSGRVIVLGEDHVQPVPLTVHQALEFLLAVGSLNEHAARLPVRPAEPRPQA